MPHFWEAPHRPLFLGAFVWAMFAILRWPLLADLSLPALGLSSGAVWHAHEMLVGFGGAAVAGYVLTALPNWTGRPPVVGHRLQILMVLWGLGRVSTTIATSVAFQTATNAGFFLYLAVLVARPVLAARRFDRLGFVGMFVAAAGGDALFLITVARGDIWLGHPMVQAAPIAFALLMAVIACRAIPAFTFNALRQRDPNRVENRPTSPVWRPAQVMLAAALLFLFLDQPDDGGVLLLITAVLMLVGMAGWRTRDVLRDPLLVALHLNFLWVPVGCFCVGLSLLDMIPLAVTDVLHILTIGAMAGLIMAMAGRAAATLAGPLLHVGQWFGVAVVIVWGALVLRISAPLVPDQHALFLHLSGSAWCLGWLVFLLGFRPALTGPPRRPVLSGRKAPPLATCPQCPERKLP